MKTYLFTFMTNYEEAGIIITTSKGIEHAKELAISHGAWDTNEITIINTTEEDKVKFINFK